MRRFLLAASGFLLIPLLLAMLVPHIIDWNSQRERVERELSQAAGFPVKVAGDIKVSLLPVPSISLGRISAENTLQGFSLEAERFAAHFAMLPLLAGSLHTSDAVLVHPVLTLTGTGSGPADPKYATRGDAPSVPPVASGKLRFLDAELRQSKPENTSKDLNPGTTILAKLDGEVNVSDKDGVIRGNAVLDAGERLRNLRFALTPQKKGMQVNLLIEDELASARYNLEGALAPGGKFIGRLDSTGALALDTARTARSLNWRISSDVILTKSEARLNEIEIVLGRQPDQSVILGTAAIDFTSGQSITAKLSTESVDLDRLLGIGRPARILPWDAVVELQELVAAAAPKSDAKLDSNTSAKAAEAASGNSNINSAFVDLTIDSLQVGGDKISNFVLAASARAKPGENRLWNVQSFTANLPAGARLDVRPASSQAETDDSQLRARVEFDVPDPDRFAEWIRAERFASKPLPGTTPAPETALQVRADAKVEEQRFSLVNLEFRQGQNVLTGDARYEFPDLKTTAANKSLQDATPSEQPQLGKVVARLHSTSLDLGALRLPAPTTDKQISPDLDLVLSSETAQFRSLRLVDASAKIERRGPVIALTEVSIADANGAKIMGHAGLENGKSKGRFTVSAARLEPLANAFRRSFPGVVSDFIDLRAADLSPMELAVDIEQAPDQGDISLRFHATGHADETQIEASGNLFSMGVTRANTIGISFNTEDETRLLRQLGFRTRKGPGNQLSKGVFNLAALGNIAKGYQLTGNAQLSSASLQLDGKLTFTNPSSPFDGTVLIKVPNVQALGGALGVDDALLPPDVALDTKARVYASLDKITLSESAIVFTRRDAQSANISGEISFDFNKDGQIAGQIKADTIDANWLCAISLGIARTVSGPREVAGAAWSASPFSVARPTGLHGDLWLEVDKLTLGTRSWIDDTQFVYRFEPGIAGFEGFDGRFSGGRISGTTKLNLTGQGLTSTSEIALKDIDADRLSSLPFAARMSGQLSLSASGVSPANYIASLSGTSSLTLNNIRLDTIDPSALLKLADTQSIPAAKSKSEQLDKAMLLGVVTAPSSQVNMTINGGILRVGPLTLMSREGPLQSQAEYSFKNSHLQAETRFEAAIPGQKPGVAAAPKQVLQGQVRWSGPLDVLTREVIATPMPVPLDGQFLSVPGSGTGSISAPK